MRASTNQAAHSAMTYIQHFLLTLWYDVYDVHYRMYFLVYNLTTLCLYLMYIRSNRVLRILDISIRAISIRDQPNC